MYCPNCAEENSSDLKFCRGCGLNLEKIAGSLLEQLPSAESAKLMKQQRNLEKFGNIALGGFGLAVLTGLGTIIYLVIVRMILSGTGVYPGILLVTFMVFAAMSLIFVIFRETSKEKKHKKNPVFEQQILQQRETSKLLEEKWFEPIQSVTEQTTDLILSKRKSSGELK